MTTRRADLKVILLGDSAVGKSKIVERYLQNDYSHRQDSTYGLSWYKFDAVHEGTPLVVDLWDTAGQDRFAELHPSYYHGAHAAILVFDVTRKVTYQHLTKWYEELRQHCESVPCVCIANKVDVDSRVTTKSFAFAKERNMPLLFVSAADGTNVVAAFEAAIASAVAYKASEKEDVVAAALELLDGNWGAWSSVAGRGAAQKAPAAGPAAAPAPR